MLERPKWLPPAPRWLTRIALVFIVLSWLPLVLIARARTTHSSQPRVHLILDMDNQPKLKTQQVCRVFADQRAMRPPVPGTVARGQLEADDAYYRGRNGNDWVTEFPVQITKQLVLHGEERFNIYCSVCHGYDGSGNGAVNQRAIANQEPGWVPPTQLYSQQTRERPVGYIFNTITNGVRNMPSYGAQIPVEDRWAIVAYVRALQLSRHVDAKDLPADEVNSIR